MIDGKEADLSAGPLSGGPVLCMDIDGVASPLGQDNRYDLDALPPGFVPYPCPSAMTREEWCREWERLCRCIRRCRIGAGLHTLCLGIHLAGDERKVLLQRQALRCGGLALPDAIKRLCVNLCSGLHDNMMDYANLVYSKGIAPYPFQKGCWLL